MRDFSGILGQLYAKGRRKLPNSVTDRGARLAINSPRQETKPLVLDLFCGAGGMSLGFHMAGYRIGLGVEKEDLPCQTHRFNFDGNCHQGDIREITDPLAFVQDHGFEEVDVVIGGPPCQGFSRVGRGKIRSLRKDPEYIHDPRNQYYKEFIRFVEVLRPSHFVMENVPDLQRYADGDGLLLDNAIKQFKHLGYRNTEARILQADHFGVPQTRRRLFVSGSLRDGEVPWPTPTHWDAPVTVWQAISDLPIIPHAHRQDEMLYRYQGEQSYYQKIMREGAGKTLYNHQTRGHNEQDLAAFEWMAEGQRYIDLPAKYKRYRDDIFKDKYRKLIKSAPSWTIEAHIAKDSYRHIYPSEKDGSHPPRTVSVREAARLQSFPDRFRFCGPFTKQFAQVGNAVPPLLAKSIAETLLPGVRKEMRRKRSSDHSGSTPNLVKAVQIY